MSQGPRWSAACLALAILAGAAAARPMQQEKTEPSDVRAVEAKLYISLRQVINRGVGLYNSGEHSACYRLYEGSLIAVAPLFDYKPELQKAIADGIEKAKGDPQVWRRAFALRSVLDKVRVEINPKKLPAPTPEEKKPTENAEEKKPVKTKPARKKRPEKKPDELLDAPRKEETPQATKPEKKKPDEPKLEILDAPRREEKQPE